MADYDVIVIGAGNAALAASVAARGAGAERVLVLEKAPEQDRGGNTHFSGGLFRFAFNRPDDLLRLVPKAREVAGFMEGIEAYPADAFREDLERVTDGRTDPELSQILIANSYDTVRWMAEQGMAFELALSLSGVRVGSVIKWPKGAIVRAAHEGVGLSRMWFNIACRAGVEIRYGSPTRSLVANMAWRAQYLGRPWDHARVRGTRHNQGDGLRMAMEIGAMPWGQWSGCHATPIDAGAPPYGDHELTDKTNRLSYVYGVMLNKPGLRFVDEGEDQNLYTYAKFGGTILNQPGTVAWQIFDSKTVALLEPRYSTGRPIVADTLAGVVAQLALDRTAAMRTLTEYNAAAGKGSFNPGVRDGMHTEGLALAKSNWAQTLDTPPYYAYPVTGGITFSFGGVKVSDNAQVIGTDWDPIPGLFACGEMVGGLFHNNYPGGSGLMSGAVFGRIAGRSASAAARAAL